MNKNKSESFKETRKVPLPEHVTLGDLQENFRIANTQYAKAHARARKLDMADRNRLWQAIKCEFPIYQILPETNHVSYIKSNILASIYTVGKCASLLPTSEHDRDITMQLNLAIEHIWGQLDVGYYQMLAGERAALLNLGITQVGWDNTFAEGAGDNFEKGRCVLRNIDPFHYVRDPFAESLDTASFVITWEDFHKSVILSNPNYKEAFQSYLSSGAHGSGVTDLALETVTDKVSSNASGQKDYYRVFTHWVRIKDKIHEIHMLDNRCVLHVKEDIQPRMFPFAELYCNPPAGDLLGTSEPNKIFANSLAYNMMVSILLTAEYKNQRPPKFVSSQAQLNIDSFTKHGNEADRTFVVNGDASKAVHYHQYPMPSQAAVTNLAVLTGDIKSITGVDDRYTGRDTGSILTTGGINSMLDQVTMIDTPKIINYEHYTKRLTKLILYNYIVLSSYKRNYFIKDARNPKKYRTITVDFPQIDNETLFNYELNISSELPKNKTVVANMANKLMEMQMQYSSQNIDVDLITPQEWLMLQGDLPTKEYMLERMGLQRTNSWMEATAQIVTQYGTLVEQGVSADDALRMTAETMQAQSAPQGGGVNDVISALEQGAMV